MRLLKALIVTSLVSTAVGSTCKYIQAHANDGCYNLAQRCGISQAELTKYNPKTGFCNNIELNEYVCCSEGSLPDFSPKPYSNGTCFTYTVKYNDNCADIATANKMDKDKIPNYNNETWGWAGCQDLKLGQRICLSDGTPPFPSAVENTLCGPQVPGTTQPKNMPVSNWTNLNPCPLNACCDIWGQCGITPDFCTPSSASTGAPGTAKNGTNGCISNCGTEITNNAHGPSEPKRIAYFEAFNKNRPCLNMDVSKLQGNSYYTDIHWAFANLTSSWGVDVSGAQDQFNGFLKLTGFNRVLSFGGWGFSTTAYTYGVFRNGVKDGNRQTFAKNVVDFIVKYDLDGVDFDWEYPGAQDIPGIPPDSKDSGENYLEFLKLVRNQLPSTKTMSIAAPASYWYLRNFPIKEISKVVDYIVYMTYDLHGQWDYQKSSADPGCPEGSCLRSQVNKTETHFALAMITKAGVQANQVVVGLPLYGRSFKMAEAGCTGPDCHFTGPTSGALEGECTNTAGYISNFEIYEILAQVQNGDNSDYGNITQYEDEGDVLVYSNTNWVSWLSPSSYASRRSWSDGLNFGGTSDWAIDLNQTYANNGTGDELGSGYDTGDALPPCDYTKKFASLDDLSAAAGDLRPDCVAIYTLQVLIDMCNAAYQNYTNVNQGYDELFGYYVTYIDKLIPAILPSEFMFNLSTTGAYAPVPNTGFGSDYFQCTVGSNAEKPCSQLTFEDGFSFKTTAYRLTDQNGYQGGLATIGLSPDWVVLGDSTYEYEFEAPRVGSHKVDFQFTGFPIKNASMVVPNPKDIVTKGLPDIPGLVADMEATILDLMMGQWYNGTSSDAAQAYSIPVFILIQAVENMAEAKNLGTQEKKDEEEEEKRKKDFILLLVSVALIFVPIVGEEFAAAAGLATLARSAAIAGELANGALAIYDTLQDPSSAVMNIIGMLLGVGAIAKVARDGEGLASIAKLRQAMKADEISSFGSLFKGNDDKLQTIMKACK